MHKSKVLADERSAMILIERELYFFVAVKLTVNHQYVESHVSSLPEPCPALLDASSLTDWLDPELESELDDFRVSL